MPRRQITPPGSHVVEQGEDVPSIAWTYGFQDWETVWNHGENGAFRAAHRSPHVLHPGAELFIPENSHARFELATGRVHRVVVEPPTTKLEVRIVVGDQPVTNRKYVLRYHHGGVDHLVDDRSTDGDGWIREANLPIDVTQVVVMIPALLRVYRFDLRSLDPTARDGEVVVSGVQARLRNLGFGCGAIDGRMGEKTVAALRAFQRVKIGREDPTGEVDDETLRALESEHGS